MNIDQFKFFMDAGGPIMWVILGLSVAGCAIVLERLSFFVWAGRRPFHPSIEAHDAETMNVLAERAVRAELFDWQRNLTLLEVIIKAAPMLGLLGTVLGMVDMFRVLSAGGGFDAGAVTEGIRTALFTTIAGLCCAIPLLVASGMLNGVIDRREERLRRTWDAWIRERVGGRDA